MHMTQTCEFRRMGCEDIDTIMKIEVEIYSFPWTHAIFKDCIGIGYDCWVLESEMIQAYGVMSIGADEAHLLNISVANQFQGKGKGKLMVRHFLNIARQKNADTAFLEVRPTNTVAIALYRNMGFTETGYRKDYYPGKKCREDALVFAKSLL